MWLRRSVISCLLSFFIAPLLCAQQTPLPLDIRLRLLRAEDTRSYDDQVKALLAHTDARVRVAAALSAGRIGDERAVAPLVELLQQDKDDTVCAMAAFALGEIEADAGADALIVKSSHENRDAVEVRARAVEALGKIAAALPETAKERKAALGAAILDALRFEAGRRSAPDAEVILAGVTAALRARPEGAGAIIAQFLRYSSPRIRADALNALARLRAKDNLPQVRELLKDPEPIVRANAARVLGAAEDKESVDALLEIATKDTDSRVRVAAIRSLGALQQTKAIKPLMQHVANLAPKFYQSSRNKQTLPGETNEILETVTAISRLWTVENDGGADTRLMGNWYVGLAEAGLTVAPEIHLALSRSWPDRFLSNIPLGYHGNWAKIPLHKIKSWQEAAGIAQGLGEIAKLKGKNEAQDNALKAKAQDYLKRFLCNQPPDCVNFEQARPDALRAYAAFKPDDLRPVLLENLAAKDVIIRATAADLLGDLPPSEENTKALLDALPIALKDSLNDAALSVLDSLAKQKNDKANEAIKSALTARDYLVRWRAIDLLKRNGAGDFSAQKFPIKSQFTEADYREALALKDMRAVVETDKGSFTIQLRPDVAPLNVLSFVRLARRGYFNGITWHRVVPNFVVQGGDPRGDGNGGPGYALRCEINQLQYERGAVGMALSGKDTGGSQWFVTHSPQPHLDGGYTVFGNVTQGLETVDKIARGDKIKRIRILIGRQ